MTTISHSENNENPKLWLHLSTCVTLLSIMFPYLSPAPTRSDTQPIALFCGAMFLCVPSVWRSIQSSRIFLMPLFVLMYSSVVWLAHRSFEPRSISSYLSIPVFFAIGRYFAQNHPNALSRCLFFSSLTWLVVALIQTFGDQTFIRELLFRATTTSDRGVGSLANEPGAYGMYMVFYSIAAMRLLRLPGGSKESNFLNYGTIVVCALQVIVLARAALPIPTLVMALASAVFLASIELPRKITLAGILFGGAISAVYFAPPGSRIDRLSNTVLRHGPTSLVLYDESINHRAGEMILSLKGSLDQLPIHGGFGSSFWPSFYDENAYKIDKFKFDAARPTRIMSGLGSSFFEIGLIAMLIPFFILANAAGSRSKTAIAHSVLIICVLFAAVPIATPIVFLVVGLMIEPVRLSPLIEEGVSS